jgi:hypothetical protein
MGSNKLTVGGRQCKSQMFSTLKGQSEANITYLRRRPDHAHSIDGVDCRLLLLRCSLCSALVRRFCRNLRACDRR